MCSSSIIHACFMPRYQWLCVSLLVSNCLIVNTSVCGVLVCGCVCVYATMSVRVSKVYSRNKKAKLFSIRALNFHLLIQFEGSVWHRICSFLDFLANYFFFWRSEIRDSCIVCMVQKLTVNGDYHEILTEGRWLMI